MDNRLPDFIRFVRELRGFSQRALARKLGITQGSLSQYENCQSTLSRQTLLKIAKLLHINPAYLSDASANPFKSSKVIKMYFPEYVLAGMDYSPLEYLLEINTSLEVFFLLATSSSKKFDQMIANTIFADFIQAVLVRDQDNNLFLFRRKRKGAYLVGIQRVQANLRVIAIEKGIELEIGSVRIPRELSKKISDLSVEREDLEKVLLKLKNQVEPSIDEEMMEEFIKQVKKGGHDLRVLQTILKEMKAKGLDEVYLLDFIRSH